MMFEKDYQAINYKILKASIEDSDADSVHRGEKLPIFLFSLCSFLRLCVNGSLILFNFVSKHLKQALLYGITLCPIKVRCKLYPPPTICGIFLLIHSLAIIFVVVSTFG